MRALLPLYAGGAALNRWNILLRQTDLPRGYSFGESEIAAKLYLSRDGELFYRHRRVGLLPVGRVHASKLMCYRSAVVFWGKQRLRLIRRWWDANYWFDEENLAALLRIDTAGQVFYRRRSIAVLASEGLQFNHRCKVIYSYAQQQKFCQVVAAKLASQAADKSLRD